MLDFKAQDKSIFLRRFAQRAQAANDRLQVDRQKPWGPRRVGTSCGRSVVKALKGLWELGVPPLSSRAGLAQSETQRMDAQEHWQYYAAVAALPAHQHLL